MSQTTDHSVYEISGLMVRDEFLKYDKLAVAEFTEIAGAVKGIYDTGIMLYNAAQYIGPSVAAAGVLL